MPAEDLGKGGPARAPTLGVPPARLMSLLLLDHSLGSSDPMPTCPSPVPGSDPARRAPQPRWAGAGEMLVVGEGRAWTRKAPAPRGSGVLGLPWPSRPVRRVFLSWRRPGRILSAERARTAPCSSLACKPLFALFPEPRALWRALACPRPLTHLQQRGAGQLSQAPGRTSGSSLRVLADVPCSISLGTHCHQLPGCPQRPAEGRLLGGPVPRGPTCSQLIQSPTSPGPEFQREGEAAQPSGSRVTVPRRDHS